MIGYSSLRNDLTRPEARRRFVHYAAARGIAFEIAQPDRRYDLVVSGMGGDLSVWSRLPRTTKLVLDFVDSYLAVPRSDPKAMARGLVKFAMGHTRRLHLNYRALMEDACRRADAVVCCTEEQRQSILEFCPNVHPILDFQPEADRRTKGNYRAGDVFNLVWEGLPENLVAFGAIAGALKELRSRRKIALHLVTDLERARVSTHLFKQPTERMVEELIGMNGVTLHAWSADTVAAVAVESDLAVIPIDLDDALATAKSENKLIFFWRMGVPVVTSATQAYLRTMAAAGENWTCRTADEWVRTIERLMDDEGARQSAGERGRNFALEAHGEGRMMERWDAALASIGGPNFLSS